LKVPTIYHTGDTDVFSDMALIGSLNKIDIMLVCIGGHFTMGPQRAALATKLVNPSIVVPMHFGSNPLHFEKWLWGKHLPGNQNNNRIGVPNILVPKY